MNQQVQMRKSIFKSKRFKELGFVAMCLVYPIVIFSIFYIGVNINSFLMSVQYWTMEDGYQFLTEDIFRHYRNFITMCLEAPIMKTAFQNTLIWYIVPLLISTPISICVAYVVFAKVKTTGVFRTLSMLPNIISGFVTTLLIKKFIEFGLPSLMQQLTGEEFPNLIKTAPTATMIFISIFLGISGNVIVLPNVMGRIPDELFESAKIDGMGNMWQELWYIILPNIYDVLSVGWITGFAGLLSAGGLLVPYYMYSAPQMTWTVGYYFWVNVAGVTSDAGFPELAAGGILMSMIMIPLTFGFKYLVEHYGPSTER